MANTTVITVGNVGKEPAMRTTAAGKNFWTFSVASTPRTNKDGEWVDGETLWFTVSTFGHTTDITKGTQVVVVGSLIKKTYEKDGETREGLYINADTVAVLPKKQDLNDYFSSQNTRGAAVPVTEVANITDLAFDAPF